MSSSSSSSMLQLLFLLAAHHFLVSGFPISSTTAPPSSSGLAAVMDGKRVAAEIRSELRDQVSQMTTAPTTIIPGLAVILVGDRRDSQTYVNMKKKACAEIGIVSYGYDFASDVSQEEILRCVEECNANPRIHGILVQLPLPPHIAEEVILQTIDPEKDVDGLHPVNVAQLCSTHTHEQQQGCWNNWNWNNLSNVPFPIPCTPQGCIELLDRYGVDIEGKHAVVLGRSNLVGVPVALLLMHRHATVTVAHSRTTNIDEVVRRADILICAVGQPGLVRKEWLKPHDGGGAVVIDVGINAVDDDTNPKGYRLVGDVDYEECQHVASLITPVPGGVGPMTIAMLMRNTVNACRRSNNSSSSHESTTVPTQNKKKANNEDK